MPRHPPATDNLRRERQLTAALARVDAQARALRTGEDWARVLRQAALLPGQSFANVLLITAQHPGATMVAGYEAWKALGRQVTRHQKGIAVLAEIRWPADSGRPTSAPAGETGSGAENTGMRLTYVWDITQTTGKANPQASPLTMPVGLQDALTWVARREGFAIEREFCGNADALTMWNQRRIRVQPGLPADHETTAILHQLGHITIHQHLPDPPCATTAGCDGIIKLEADSAAYVVCARYAIPAPDVFPAVATWAGTDARARPELTIRATGARITTAASRLGGHLASMLPPSQAAVQSALARDDATRAVAARISDGRQKAAAVRLRAEAAIAASQPQSRPPAPGSQALADAEMFYLARAPDSWVPAYAQSRGLDDAAVRDCRIGYAPAGWTTLTDHLRGLGHSDQSIEAAGLARRSSRGTLIDHFRDRAMLAIRDEHGTIAGFIGRARPGAGPANPKYLNSPQTASYTKGDILLGLYQSRDALARGATPVLAEGPFDAIAITSCAPGRYVGLAACGTALTGSQLAALSRVCDLPNRGVIVASDGDEAGRRAAARAYYVIRAFTTRSAWVSFPAGQDPAAIFQSAGPDALAAILRDRAQPLARLVVEDEIDRLLTVRETPHQALTTMRATAQLIAELLPAPTAQAITTVTAGRELRTWAEDLRPVADPAVEKIARLLAADAAHQVAVTADRLGFDYSDVIIEVANAVAQQAGSPKRLAGRDLRHDLARGPMKVGARPYNLAASNFPYGRAWMTADRPQDTPVTARDIRSASTCDLVRARAARPPGRSR